MRLQEVTYRCKEAWSFLDPSSYKRFPKTTGNDLPTERRILRALYCLEPIDFFKNDIAGLRGMIRYMQPSAKSDESEGTYPEAFIFAYKKFEEKLGTIVGFLDSISCGKKTVDTTPDNGFDVKLPANISLTELSKCTKDLNTILSTCPLLISEDGSITFSTVDVGSVWLNFVVAGAAVTFILNGVAALVDKALIIRSHNLTAKEQEEKIRSLQLGNDFIESAKEINDNIGKNLLNKVSSELANQNNITDPEDFARLKNTVQLLSDWMTKGMEVYASIHAPDEIKAVFPPIEKQALPASAIKMITDGSDISEK